MGKIHRFIKLSSLHKKGAQISTQFYESEKSLLSSFGSIPGQVRWHELFEQVASDLDCPVSGPDDDWTLERTNHVWHKMRNLLQSKTTDVVGSITLDERDKLLNVKKVSVESGDQEYIKEA